MSCGADVGTPGPDVEPSGVDVASLLAAPALVLLLTLVIGALSLWLEKRRSNDVITADVFFTGNRQLRSVPMSASLITTLMTPLSWLTLPTYVALHGVVPALAASLGLALVTPVAALVFLPVFFNIQPTTAFEYLEQRFSTPVKLLASGLFVCHTLTSLPALLYVPFNALQQVMTGMPMLYAGPIVLLCALTYTVLGGMRALQWSACAHLLFCLCSLLSVLVLAYTSVPNPEFTWSQLINKHPQLFSIGSLEGWGAGLGVSFWVGSLLVAGQQQVQRYLSVPLLSQATTGLVLAALGLLVLGLLQVGAGVLMVVHEAQPTTPLDEHCMHDYQTFAKFCLTMVQDVPGLNGLFVASVCCIVLSAVASGVHALAAVLTVDVWGARKHTRELPVSRARWVVALASVLVLVVSALMPIVPEPLLSVAILFPRVTGGALLGLFCLGMLIPWANTPGAVIGAVLGLAVVWWTAMGSRLVHLPLSQSLPQNSTAAIANSATAMSPALHNVVGWNLSAEWLSPLGCAVTLLSGALVSAVLRPRDSRALDPDLVAPGVRWLHTRLWGWSIGDTFQDSSSVKDDFQYEAVASSRQDVAYAPAVVTNSQSSSPRRRFAQRQTEAWPDIAYPHLSRRNNNPRAASSETSRPRSGLAWDHVTGTLYLSDQ